MDWPLLNASLNGASTVLLLTGYGAIRRGREQAHKRCMLTATATSTVFLACYLYYHLLVRHGEPTRFNGVGLTRGLYLILLTSHTLLAVVNLPLVITTLRFAHRRDWIRHKRWARRTFPIWLYVSITGVLVYVVVYHFNPPPATP